MNYDDLITCLQSYSSRPTQSLLAKMSKVFTAMDEMELVATNATSLTERSTYAANWNYLMAYLIC